MNLTEIFNFAIFGVKYIGAIILICAVPFLLFWGITIPMAINSIWGISSPWVLILFVCAWIVTGVYFIYKEEKRGMI